VFHAGGGRAHLAVRKATKHSIYSIVILLTSTAAATDFERSVWKKLHTSQAAGYAASVFQPGTWPAAARSPSLSQSCQHLAVAALAASLALV
jgi:hypothetical protein